MESIYEKIKYFFLNSLKRAFTQSISILSLNTPSSRIIMIIFCSTYLFLFPISYLPLFSVFSKLGIYDVLGFEFYSSGMTRALKSFFEGNFEKSYEYNPLVFLFMLFLILLLVLDFYRLIVRKNSNSLLKKKIR